MPSASLVVAVEEITEENFNGATVHIHALPGDVGNVLAADGEWVNVWWVRTGTVTLCHTDAVVFLDAEQVSRALQAGDRG